MRPSLAVEEAVQLLGSNLKAARLRRRLPQSVIAERSGVSINTLSKLENGDCGVTIGNVAAVMNALGLLGMVSELASSEQDRTGLMLEERRLPQRVRRRKTEGEQN